MGAIKITLCCLGTKGHINRLSTLLKVFICLSVGAILDESGQKK